MLSVVRRQGQSFGVSNWARPSHLGVGYSEDGRMYTLNTIERHSVCYGISRDAFNLGENGGGMSIIENVQPNMMSNSPGAVCYALYAYDMHKGATNSGPTVMIINEERNGKRTEEPSADIQGTSR